MRGFSRVIMEASAYEVPFYVSGEFLCTDYVDYFRSTLQKKEIFSVAVKTAEYGYSTTLSGLN